MFRLNIRRKFPISGIKNTISLKAGDAKVLCSDFMGSVLIPKGALWGAQTQRSMENFTVGEIMPIELIRAFGIQKQAAAITNTNLELLNQIKGHAITEAAEEVAQGRHDNQFNLRIYQTGSGTQTHMNVNEVIANRANHIIEAKYPHSFKDNVVHPNDHVNLCQSSNDSFPTAMHISAIEETTTRLIPAITLILTELEYFILKNGDEFRLGRTHVQDATPITIRTYVSSFTSQMRGYLTHLKQAISNLYSIGQGGTAVGTGIGADKNFASLFVNELNILFENKKFAPMFTLNDSKLATTASHDAILHLGSVLASIATGMRKLSNDIILLNSGPRSGFGEFNYHAEEPGSSVMPGKTNPTQCEAMNMISCQVLGYYNSMLMANSLGTLELNVYKPLMIFNTLQSINILSGGITAFSSHCIRKLTINKETMQKNVQNSLMLSTIFATELGYERTAEITKLAEITGKSLKQVLVHDKKYLNEQQYDTIIKGAFRET